MNGKRIGGQTVCLGTKPVIIASASVGGKREGRGPTADTFDFISNDAYFGKKTWEDAESAMVKRCFEVSLQKAALDAKSLDYIFCGDLLNQCVGSAFGLKDSGVPLFGLYSACSTMAESLSLAAMSIDGGFAESVCAISSSHFCTAERQFRFPLNYGCLRTPTSQWTVTAAGSLILSSTGAGPVVTHVTTGKIVDGGITDANNMGAAMAPAAMETLCTHFADTGRTPDDYDLIVTGDLGEVGSSILRELCLESGYDIFAKHHDCGLTIYPRGDKDVCAGGSGCGCAASMLAGHFLPLLQSGKNKRMLFEATGAIMSPTTAMQGKSILGICHAVAIESVCKGE
jgi:stage V sporulation protein AD